MSMGRAVDEGLWSSRVRLTVELPETCWYSNLRSELPTDDWQKLRGLVLEHAESSCEICGTGTDEGAFECEAIWSYDDHHHVQRLERMMALCPACHEVKHIDLAARLGHADRALAHLANVNGWDERTAGQHVAQAYEQWERRSQHDWSLEIGWLRDYGIEPAAPLSVSEAPRVGDSFTTEAHGLSVRAINADTLGDLLDSKRGWPRRARLAT